VLEYDGTGTVLRRYTYGSGIDEVLNLVNADGSRAILVPDIQGSLIASVDSATGTITRQGVQAYGESADASGSFRYTGRRIDAETLGLYYYRARMYSPGLGRFMQPDPIGYAGGANLYAYVGNDPLNRLDPLGLAADQVFDTSQYFGSTNYFASRVAMSPFAADGTCCLSRDDLVVWRGWADDNMRTLGNGGEDWIFAIATLPVGGEGFAAESVAQVTLNRAAGLAAERVIADELIAEGNVILGSQVGVQTSQGLRIIDHLYQTPAGDIFACEVKCGGGIRTAMQILKDETLATEGGIFTGRNAANPVFQNLNGQPISTVVRRVP
jgi:RHS repeat-associated protein